jgi:hypothetical protein
LHIVKMYATVLGVYNISGIVSLFSSIWVSL